MLDAEDIRQPISPGSGEALDALEVFSEIESTNSYLLAQPAPPRGRFRVALAEHQTAGRGRLGRQWQSPPSSGLCMSMSYTFAGTPAQFSAVTLAIGTGVATALEAMGVRGVGLKWPNDIVIRDGKLGGILTELRTAKGGDRCIVIGVGINVDLRGARGIPSIKPGIGHISDLASCMLAVPARSLLSAALIEQLFSTLSQFEAEGFAAFHAAWERFDWLRGQVIGVESGEDLFTGVSEGIDSDGALLLRTDCGRQRILSGSVRWIGRQERR